MSYLNEFLSLLYNIAPNMHLGSILLIELFLVVLLSAINRERFKKIVLCLVVLIQAELFFLAGTLTTAEGWGAIVAIYFAVGLNFVAGVLGFLVWWRLRDSEHPLGWLQFTSILFLLVFPLLIVQMIFKPLFSPISQYLGHQAVQYQKAIDKKVQTDRAERAIVDYPKLLEEFKMPQYVVAVDPDSDKNFGLFPIIIVSSKDGGNKKYLYINPRRTNNDLNGEKSRWQQLANYMQTTLLANQEVMIELPSEKDFMDYYWEYITQPSDSKYIHIPIQEIVLSNGTRIYNQFLSQK